MDAFARGLLVAHVLLSESPLRDVKGGATRAFDAGSGCAFEQGDRSLVDLRDHAAAPEEPATTSGKQDWLANAVNDTCFAAADYQRSNHGHPSAM